MFAVLAVALAAQVDSVTLDAADYLARVMRDGPAVASAQLRADAARHAAAQAGAWTNPFLALSVDNVGAEEEVTGITGTRGLEGQAVVGFRLPLGGDRGAARDEARGFAAEAEAGARQVRLSAAAAAASALARARRDRRLEALAADELEALGTLADALGAQAAAGRAAEADAARARLAVAVAREALALRAASAAASAVEVAHRAGLTPGTTVAVRAVACGPPPDSSAVGSPLVEAAEARVQAARGAEAVAAALRIPDLEPQVGVRRTMGTEALYAGFGVGLPLFDRGGRRLQAARAVARASEIEAAQERRRVEGETAAARAGLAALEEAGASFRTPRWEEDLAGVVEAARTRLELGEGSLMELLDVRRARLQALESRERWAAEWQIASAALTALEGREPTPRLFCDPLIREDR